MKALTLTQPFATLIAIGAKRLETRTWSTTYRGPLAIHAAFNFPVDCRMFAYRDPAGQVLNDAGILLGGDCAALPRGAIVAVARVVAVHSPFRFAWVLAEVRRLPEPIACKGALGLWTVPPAIVEKLHFENAVSARGPGQ